MALVERTKLNPGTAEYNDVAAEFKKNSRVQLFKKGAKKLQILSIERVNNSSLQTRFENKKQQYERDFGHVRVVKGWHGTKNANVSSILQNNFDCKHKAAGRYRFGMGVSFSSMSSYAAHFSSFNKSSTPCMILADVLVSNVVEVPENRDRGTALREPPLLPGQTVLRYDTTAKSKTRMDVFVKFDMDAFVPTHVVHFSHTAQTGAQAEAQVDSDDYSPVDSDDYYSSDCDSDGSRLPHDLRELLRLRSLLLTVKV